MDNGPEVSEEMWVKGMDGQMDERHQMFTIAHPVPLILSANHIQ